jgi:hypothetical protein
MLFHLRSPEVIRSGGIAALALASLLASFVIVQIWPDRPNIAQNGWANARLLAAKNPQQFFWRRIRHQLTAAGP